MIFSLASWDPSRSSLFQWLAEQLEHNYPGLVAVASKGERTSARLIEGGYVLPVLDGLDALPHDLRPSAIKGINNSALPFLLTSRDGPYLTAFGGGVPPTQATVVKLLPLTAEEVIRYLADTTASDTWEEVLDRPRRDRMDRWPRRCGPH